MGLRRSLYCAGQRPSVLTYNVHSSWQVQDADAGFSPGIVAFSSSFPHTVVSGIGVRAGLQSGQAG